MVPIRGYLNVYIGNKIEIKRLVQERTHNLNI